MNNTMNLTFAPDGTLQIDNARICYRNFAGKGTDYNREGDRNFALVIPSTEMANALREDGWNVKERISKYDDQEEPFYTLAVKVKFNGRGPNCYIVSGRARRQLTEENVGRLDKIDIKSVNMDIRPYDWKLKTGKSGRSAYLSSIEVIQDIDRFAAKYAEEECPDEAPFEC